MGGGPCSNSFLCIWVQAEVMQLELGSSFKLVGEVLEVWARRRRGWSRASAVRARLIGRWKCGQGEEEDGPWVVRATEARGNWEVAPRSGRRRRNEE